MLPSGGLSLRAFRVYLEMIDHTKSPKSPEPLLIQSPLWIKDGGPELYRGSKDDEIAIPSVTNSKLPTIFFHTSTHNKLHSLPAHLHPSVRRDSINPTHTYALILVRTQLSLFQWHWTIRTTQPSLRDNRYIELVSFDLVIPRVQGNVRLHRVRDLSLLRVW